MKPSAFRWPVLLGLYLASRLVGLMALPMFLDERIHLRWAYWIEQGRRLRVPLLAGRGLSVYLLAGIAPHADDPLRAGRLLTVAIGLVTLVACHRLALRLTGDRRVADVTALFYIACPFTLLYDRMVLTDAFLAAFTALTLLLSVAVAEEPRPRSGVALGLAIAFGVLSKTTGLVLFVFPLLAWALLGRDRRRALGPLAAAYALAATLVAYPLWLFFRKTDELAGAIGLRDGDTSFAGNASTNLGLAAAWLWTYWTPPLIVLALAGLAAALGRRERARGALLLALLAVGPAVAFVAVSEIWYPRYLLFTTVSLLPLSAWGLLALADLAARHLRSGPAVQAVLAAAGLVLVLLPALRFDRALWTDPTQAPLPALDRFQYVTGWPSGYGSRDSMAFLRTERERRPDGLLLVTPGPSTTASAIRLLWAKDQAVEVRAVDPGEAAPGAGARRAVYVIVSLAEGVRLPPDWARDLRLELTSFKPDGTPADALYRACAAEACP
ncbi:MAG TPA: glycosyltransferase family 39 protein [Vicinamibacteria bacterium]|nr:glycosyltransferase family 39 protein [Vicinamibacteria bacterium]